MNTLSKYDDTKSPFVNEMKEDQVKFFTKRLLTLFDSGFSVKKALNYFKEDSYFAAVYPKLSDKLKENPDNYWKTIEEFEDFSNFWKEVVSSAVESGNISQGLRALLATASYEESLNLHNIQKIKEQLS